jgi:hypothetical protein
MGQRHPAAIKSFRFISVICTAPELACKARVDVHFSTGRRTEFFGGAITVHEYPGQGFEQDGKLREPARCCGWRKPRNAAV